MSFARPSWCLTIWMLLCLFLVPTADAVNLPQAAVAAQQTSTPAASTTAEGEPTLEDKKAAYAALANILENNDSRQELIEQLRQAAASKAVNEQPVLAPPQADQEDPTVLESVTNVTREYGGAVASQFVRLHDNIVNAPHKSFNQQTFFNALKYFAGLAAAVFAFYWFTRLLM